jgi:hypothetical protein
VPKTDPSNVLTFSAKNWKADSILRHPASAGCNRIFECVAGNGKKYANRYRFYFLFDGDRLAQVREYNDVNLVREVFFS